MNGSHRVVSEAGRANPSHQTDISQLRSSASAREALQASEYGFWANVNPAVPHPRWSQASEEVIGTDGEHRPTLIFNGYGDYVAGIYKGLEASERLWA